LLSVFFSFFFGQKLHSKSLSFSPFWFTSLTRLLFSLFSDDEEREGQKTRECFCSQLSFALTLSFLCSFLDADRARMRLFHGTRRGTARILVRKNPKARDEREIALARIVNAQNELPLVFFFSESFEKKEKGARSL
jgi:hypothetical protein